MPLCPPLLGFCIRAVLVSLKSPELLPAVDEVEHLRGHVDDPAVEGSGPFNWKVKGSNPVGDYYVGAPMV